MSDIASLGIKVESNLKTLNKEMEKTISLSEKVTSATEKMKAQMAGVSSTTKNVITEEVKRQKSIDNLIKSLTLQEIKLSSGKAALVDYKLSLLGATEAEKKQAAAISANIKKMEDSALAIRKAERASTGLELVSRTLTRVLTTLGATFGVRKIIDYADMWTMVQGRMSLVTKNTSELIAVQSKLFELAQETRMSFESTADLYTRVARSTESVTKTQNDLLSATENINKAMIISGSSVESANAAIIQLGQGFASGTLQGEELRSVLEQTPRLARAIADGMGVAVGELRKMGKEGKLTSEEVFKAILSQSAVLEQEFGKMPKTVKQGLTLVDNAIMTFIGQMNDSYGVTKTLAGGLTILSENIESLAKAGFVLLGAAIPATITAIASAMKALTVIMTRNPIGLIAVGISSAVAAMIAYKDSVLDIGTSTATALEWAKSTWNETGGVIVAWGSKIYTSITESFKGLGDSAGSIAAFIGTTYTENFSKIMTAAKTTINIIVGGFIGTGVSIGNTAAFIYESFENAFNGIVNVAIAAGKDIKKALSGDVDFSNTIQTASENAKKSIAGFNKYIDESASIFKTVFQTDYVGAFGASVTQVGANISKGAKDLHATTMANAKEKTDAEKAAAKALEDEMKATKTAIELSKEAKKEKEASKKLEEDRLKNIADIIKKLEEERDTLDMTKEQLIAYKLALLKATPAQIAFATAIQKEISAAEERKKVTADFKSLQEKLNPELKRQNDLMADFKIVNDAFAMGLIKTKDEADKLKDALEFNSFSGAVDELKDKLKFEGTSFGNEIADGINNAVISMQKFNDQLDKQTKYQKDIDKLQKEIDTTSDLDLKAKKQKEMDDLAQEGIKGQLSAYRQLFGTTSQLFKENSKERKALHNLEMAFAMAEIAMNLQKTISAAYTAIMIQGTGDPYSAFGRIAAMTALAGGIVAAAGGSLSGGGSGSAPTAVSSASQSTALGSTEQSQSIANAFSFLEDIESGQYNELKDISSSMKDLNKNITGLVTSIVRTGGVSEFAGTAGTSGGTSDLQNMLGKALVPWGVLGTPLDIMNKATGGNQFLNAALNTLSIGLGPINDFFTGLGNQVSSALFGGSKKTSILSSGLQITPGTIGSGEVSTQAYADIKVKKEGGLFGSDKTYFKTLTDEVDQSVQDMVSLVFKNMGETMVDIAKGFGTENLEEVFNYVFDIGKIDLKGLDTEGINKALQEAFSTASDKAATDLFGELIGRYQKIGEGSLETAVRLVGEKAVVMDVLELTNQGFDGSEIPAKALEVTQSLIDMAGGLDKLTDAASTYYDKFFSDAEKQTRLQGQLSESLGAVGLELPKTREGYRELVEAQKLNIESNQEAYVTLLGLSEGADKYYTSLENGNKVLAENQKNILSINAGLEKSMAQMDMTPFEKSLDDVNTSTANTIKTLKDYGATEEQLANARLYGQKQIESLTKAEEKRIEDLEKANKRLYDNKMVELLEAEGKSTEALILKRQLELDNMDESLVPMQKRIDELQDESKALELSIKANKEFTESILANIQAQEDARKSQEDRVNNSSYELYLELLREEGKISSAQNLERKARLNELNHIALEDTQKEIWALQDKRKQEEMMVTILELEGKTTESVMLARKLEFATMEESLKPLQNRISQLQDEAKIKELSNNITAKTIEILKLQGKEEEALAIQRKMEMESLDPALREFQKIIYALEDEKKAADLATEALNTLNETRQKELETQITAAKDAVKTAIDSQIAYYQEMANKANEVLTGAIALLDRSFAAEQAKITSQHEELLKGLTDRLDEASTAASDLEGLFNSLADARKNMFVADSEVLQYQLVQKQLFDSLNQAKSGDFSGAKALSETIGVLGNNNKEMFANEQDYKRDFYKTYNALSELEKLTGVQLTEQQQIVKNLENQIAVENTNHAASMAALQAQYDAVIGVNNSVVSFEQAVLQYQQAQYAADGANTLLKDQTTKLTELSNYLLQITNSTIEAHNDRMAIAQAINNLQFLQAQATTIPSFASGGYHSGGLRIVGEVGAELEYTPPANITSNNDLKSMMSNEEVVAELRSLRAELARANFEIAKNTQDSAKTLKKFDYDGMPEQRTA